MTKQDQELIKEMLNDVVKLHLDPIKIEISYIKEQVTRTNGRVNKLEEKAETLALNDVEHVINCPMISRVKELENTDNNRKGQIKMVGIISTVAATITAIIISIAAIIFKN